MRGGHDDIIEYHPYDALGLHLQLVHVAECIAEGRRDSPVMPLDETLAILRTMDAIRAQVGVSYEPR